MKEVHIYDDDDDDNDDDDDDDNDDDDDDGRKTKIKFVQDKLLFNVQNIYALIVPLLMYPYRYSGIIITTFQRWHGFRVDGMMNE